MTALVHKRFFETYLFTLDALPNANQYMSLTGSYSLFIYHDSLLCRPSDATTQTVTPSLSILVAIFQVNLG